MRCVSCGQSVGLEFYYVPEDQEDMLLCTACSTYYEPSSNRDERIEDQNEAIAEDYGYRDGEEAWVDR